MKAPRSFITRVVVARSRRRRGFTLIELMVVLVIAGVLTAIALPSFLNQIRKSRRAEGITEVHRIAQAEERFRSTNPTYSTNFASTVPGGLGLLATGTATTTYNSLNGYYSFAVTLGAGVLAGRQYTVTATAINAMTADTNCRTLSMLMDSGRITYESRNSANVLNGAQVNNACWNRG